MDFLNYVKVKNKICLIYLGYYDFILRDLIKYQQSQDMELYVCVRDNLFSLVESNKNTLKISDYNKNDYGYSYEVKYNLVDNPVNCL